MFESARETTKRKKSIFTDVLLPKMVSDSSNLKKKFQLAARKVGREAVAENALKRPQMPLGPIQRIVHQTTMHLSLATPGEPIIPIYIVCWTHPFFQAGYLTVAAPVLLPILLCLRRRKKAEPRSLEGLSASTAARRITESLKNKEEAAKTAEEAGEAEGSFAQRKRQSMFILIPS